MVISQATNLTIAVVNNAIRTKDTYWQGRVVSYTIGDSEFRKYASLRYKQYIKTCEQLSLA